MKPFAGVILSALMLVAWAIPPSSAADTPDSTAVPTSVADTSGIAPIPPAGSAADSVVTPPLSADSTAAPGASLPITVTLKNGTERRYQRVESWPGDFVRALRADGKYDYIPKHHIEKITSELTKDVLEHGGTVGKTPEEKSRRRRALASFAPRVARQEGVSDRPAGILARFNDPPNQGESSRNHWFDAGGMANLSPKLALGGTLGVATDYDWTRVTAKARLRRWFGNGLALDFAPGIFVSHLGTLFNPNPDLSRNGVGFVGELSFAPTDYLALSYMIEIVGVDRTSYIPGTGYQFSTTSETDVGHFFGLKGAGVIGFAGMGLMMIGMAAASN